MTEPLLDVEDLSVHLPTEDGVTRAVDGISFDVEPGETVCLVGESGSGKTLTCDSITGLVSHPNADVSGDITFEGEKLLTMGERSLQPIRGDRIAYVFQNAQSALDPVYTVGEQIVEAITFHEDVSERAARDRAVDLLRTVELSRPAERLDQYPHEFSDGMCQRVALAIALAARPDLLIADEPTAALDVTIQARIIDLLRRIQADRQLSVLLVTHDLRVVSELGDRVVVLYDGVAVERGSVESVFERLAHPYTQMLLRSFAGGSGRVSISTVEETPDGCRFRRECPHAVEACVGDRPSFYPVDDDRPHEAACIYHGSDRDSSTVMAESPPSLGTWGTEPTERTEGTDE